VETIDHEVVTHAFARVADRDDGAGYRKLLSIWSRCAADLRVTQEVAGSELPTRLPDDHAKLSIVTKAATVREIAAAENRGGTCQAIVREYDDSLVLSLAAVMADDGPVAAEFHETLTASPESPWREFDGHWTQLVCDDLTDLVGLVRIYLAKVKDDGDELLGVGSRLAHLIPEPSIPAASWAHGVLIDPDIAMWELSDVGGHAADRRFLVLARSGAGKKLGDLVWFDGELALPPLTRYLLHAANIRAEHRVFHEIGVTGKSTHPAAGAPALPERRRAVDDAASGIRREALAPAGVADADAGPIDADLQTAAALLFAMDELAADLEIQAATTAASTDIDTHRNVVLVCGADRRARRAMGDFLHALDLRTRDWPSLFDGAGPAVVEHERESIERFLGAGAVVVVLTPDDVVSTHPEVRSPEHREPGAVAGDDRPVCQPRAEVLIRLGMALAAFPDQTVVVQIGTVRPVDELRPPNVVRIDGTAEPLQRLARVLKRIGCPVREEGDDWLDPTDFRALNALRRRPIGA
jgi:hypothetical protein